jgi:hypothetical protein
MPDLCGYNGCVREADHGRPGARDRHRNHKYNAYGTKPAPVRKSTPERTKAVSVPSVPSEPPDTPVMRSLQMRRKGITYKPGRSVKISGSARVWFFSEEIWAIDHPGWEWVQVKDARGNPRIFPLHRLD